MCGTDNDDLAVICTSCKAYLQAKIDTLDLFSSIWGMIESPARTLRRVVLAHQKNYVFLLVSLSGIAAFFRYAWYRNWEQNFENFFSLGAAGVLFGPFVGVVIFGTGSIVIHQLGVRFGGRGTLRNSFAALAYSLTPILFSLVFIFPVEVAVFGLGFFGTNPGPMIIGPGSYIILMGLDGLAFVWSLFLLVEGITVVHSLSRVRAGLVLLIAVISIGGILKLTGVV